MKIAIIGGAGVRVPLLVGGLVRSDLPITDIALYDIDQDRLRVIAELARLMVARAGDSAYVGPDPVSYVGPDRAYVGPDLQVGPDERPDLKVRPYVPGSANVASDSANVAPDPAYVGPDRAYVAPDLQVGPSVQAHATPESAIEGADFVITSIRVGGIGQRARDEAAAIAHDAIGQETVGPAGFAMALRTIPAMVDYAKLTSRLAPRAWLITFTNPVSIVTQAMVQESGARVIGICDTPYEIFEDAAHALGLPARDCAYDYFGLNHLGWLREVYHEGVPQLGRLWKDPQRLQSAYRTPLFETDRLQHIKLLPTEYVYYYYRPAVALENLRRAGTSRGAVVAQLTDALFADLARGVDDPLARYEQYLAARDASYMQIESGSTTPRVKPDWAELSGYDRIALMTMRAIALDTRDVIPLDVANHGNLPFLLDQDVIEVPCVVDRNGPRPLHVPSVPEHCEDLILRVKMYERATVRAAITGQREDRVKALQMNPLVSDRAKVPALVDALMAP